MIIKKRTVLFFSRSCGTFFDCFECSLPYCMCAICSVSFFTRAPFVPHKMPVAVLVARDWCVMNSLVRDRKARCQCSDVQDFPAFLWRHGCAYFPFTLMVCARQADVWRLYFAFFLLIRRFFYWVASWNHTSFLFVRQQKFFSFLSSFQCLFSVLNSIKT